MRSCKNKKTGLELAVKTISKSKLVCKEDVKDVQAEVAIMNLVAGHRNVVTLHVGRRAAAGEYRHIRQVPLLHLPCCSGLHVCWFAAVCARQSMVMQASLATRTLMLLQQAAGGAC